ncbi:MAG TPA: septum formation initiator family protein [Candidatus Limnocylindria bacterium]|nr:septum formation initiator family protein [Candidatus Limnocylindria bacterium]
MVSPGRGQILGLLTAALMVWLGASTLFGDSGVLVWLQRRGERDRVGAETLRLARETHDLEAAIARVRSGEGLEALAREQLGLVRPDEVVYRFRRPAAGAAR